MIEQLVQLLKEIQQSGYERDEIFPLYAKMLKQLFDALIKEGFTTEQAIELVKTFFFGGK